MIRRAAARRDSDGLAVADADLAFAVSLATVGPPAVTNVGIALAPVVAVHELFDDGDEVVVLEPDIWAGVDVVPVALADAPFVIRSPSVRLEKAQLRSMPLLDAVVEAPRARIEPPPIGTGRPASLELMRRRATPPGEISKADLRSHLLALFKASRCASPSDLALVGIYHQVPGGAIGSVAVDAESLVIRLVPGRRARPSTLVVGRVKASQQLVTVEISA
ncbi:MAG: hypothetical protein QOE98_1983 [Gaiellaceae bacterium]|nr:hypothetical protein [Gaiellaceae bacterium]